MPVLLVSYELKNKARDYTQFFNAIKSNSTTWMHYLGNTWVVESHLNATQYAQKLYPFFETTDFLLVVRITRERQGWLPKEAWDWFNKVTY